jgi:phosphate transport system substrate-binding protein
MKKTLIAAAVIGAMTVSAQAMARDNINIVGSSTVFPFSTAVAENFGNTTDFKTPKIE